MQITAKIARAFFVKALDAAINLELQRNGKYIKCNHLISSSKARVLLGGMQMITDISQNFIKKFISI
jgi:hypothetical protein